ncbi:hypothetical protein ASD89_01555 [Caulobacter sp. Root656]|nr:hypothetical protein ASD89_01555 [Caulobacter sp. Root656]
MARTTEWIAGDGRWPGGVLRLCVLMGASVAYALVRGHARGRPTMESLLLGLMPVLVFAIPFALWRFMEFRRRARRRREKAIRPVDLG